MTIPSKPFVERTTRLTITHSLKVITKAGVPANKVLMGITSYGRSFRMADSRCDGPICTYTGTRKESNAYPGRCTGTPGYISNAEIQEIIKRNPQNYPLRRQSFDRASESNILIYGTAEKADYVAYMDDNIKRSRSDWARGLNLGGTTDWAVDLMEFVDDNEVDPDDACRDEDKTYSSNGPSRVGDHMPWYLMDPENALASTKQYVTIVNLTPHNFKLTSTHKHRMDAWDWDDIPQGKARQNVAEYTKAPGSHVDDNGEAYYAIENTDKKFFVRVTTHIPDTYPMRIVFDLSEMGKGQREYKCPGPEVPVTLVITGSDSFGFITSLSFGPGNWMSSIKDHIKHRRLSHVVMPGTHDAGMSAITTGFLGGGTEVNTQTQKLNIFAQLMAGSRWFDLRVVSMHDGLGHAPEFWTLHVNEEANKVVLGASGEKFDQVIDGINRFTAQYPGEIIILQFRYLLGRFKTGAGPLYWNNDLKDDFFNQLRRINRRCPNLKPAGAIQALEIGELMSKNRGEGCVLIFLDTKHFSNIPDPKTSPSDGIYDRNDMAWTDAWPQKDNTKEMAESAISWWKSRSSETLHVAQWLCTPKGISEFYGLQDVALLPTNPALYWLGINEMSPETFPNVLMVDYIGLVVKNEAARDQLSAELYTLAIGLNLYTVSENCTISKRRSPLLPSLNRAMRISNVNPLVSSWNGIIFANGTRIDNPPPSFHLGRVETLKNGTVFSNGTVLGESVRNPDYDSPFY